MRLTFIIAIEKNIYFFPVHFIAYILMILLVLMNFEPAELF